MIRSQLDVCCFWFGLTWPKSLDIRRNFEPPLNCRLPDLSVTGPLCSVMHHVEFRKHVSPLPAIGLGEDLTFSERRIHRNGSRRGRSSNQSKILTATAVDCDYCIASPSAYILTMTLYAVTAGWRSPLKVPLSLLLR